MSHALYIQAAKTRLMDRMIQRQPVILVTDDESRANFVSKTFTCKIPGSPNYLTHMWSTRERTFWKVGRGMTFHQVERQSPEVEDTRHMWRAMQLAPIGNEDIYSGYHRTNIYWGSEDDRNILAVTLVKRRIDRRFPPILVDNLALALCERLVCPSGSRLSIFFSASGLLWSYSIDGGLVGISTIAMPVNYMENIRAAFNS